ncbi:MAG: hypothetical protein ACON4Z_08375, partial [Planctomycetota bacterium]
MTATTPRAAALAGALSLSLALSGAASAQNPAGLLKLRFAAFDPVVTQPELPAGLESTDAQRLVIVQFDGLPTQRGRDLIAAAGGEVVSYLPENAYVVRVGRDAAAAIGADAGVRWVGAYHPAYRLDPALVAGGALQDLTPRAYNVVVADKRADKPALRQNVVAIGGAVLDMQTGGLLMTVALTGPQLAQAAGFDQVLWIDAATATEEDMDNARIQGGGNYIESQAGYTGAGVNTHIYEGVEASHPDFTGPVTNVRSSGAAQSHGHATAGIVFGNGTSNPAVRGMAPDAGKFYTNYGSVSGSRWQVFSDLVNIHNV